GVEGLGLARLPHPANAVPPQPMLVQHDANRPALFGDASPREEGEEDVLLLGVVALVGKLLEEPGRPLREPFGEGPARLEACHGLFQQLEPTLDQLVLGLQAFDRFHDGFSSNTSSTGSTCWSWRNRCVRSAPISAPAAFWQATVGEPGAASPSR